MNISASRNSIPNNSNNIPSSAHPSFLSPGIHTPNVSNVGGNYITGNNSAYHGSFNSNVYPAVNFAEKSTILEKPKPLSIHTPSY